MQHRLLSAGRIGGDNFDSRLVRHFADEVDPCALWRIDSACHASPIDLSHLPPFELSRDQPRSPTRLGKQNDARDRPIQAMRQAEVDVGSVLAARRCLPTKPLAHVPLERIDPRRQLRRKAGRLVHG